MSNEGETTLKPEEKELQIKLEELNKLENTLEEREYGLEKFTNDLIKYEETFMSSAGEKLKAIDEVIKKIDYAVSKLPSDERETYLQNSKGHVNPFGKLSGIKSEINDNTKKLYREIARLIHPDLAADEEDLKQRHALMSEANEAYEELAKPRLVKIFIDWRSKPPAEEGSGVGAELVRVVRKKAFIDERIDIIKDEMDTLRNSSLYEQRNKQTTFDDIGEIAEDRLIDALYDLGLIQYQLGDYKDALSNFEKVTESKPDYLEAWYGKGVVLAELGRYEEAVEAYDKVLEGDSEYYEALIAKGASLSMIGKYEEATEAYQKVLAEDPENSSAWYGVGFSLDQLGILQEALVAYDKTIEINPEYPGVWFNKGVVLGKLDRYGDEIQAYDRALELNPEDEDAMANKNAAIKKTGG